MRLTKAAGLAKAERSLQNCRSGDVHLTGFRHYCLVKRFLKPESIIDGREDTEHDRLMWCFHDVSSLLSSSTFSVRRRSRPAKAEHPYLYQCHQPGSDQLLESR